MRYLWLISLLFFFCACSKQQYSFLQSTTEDKSCIAHLKPEFSSVLYNAKIDVVGKHLSGLLLFKTMPDSSKRVVFSNEMGVKFFDFEYAKTGFKVQYVIKQLDRKAAIRQLKEDIGYLIMNDINLSSAELKKSDNQLYFGFAGRKSITYYITDLNCLKVGRIENASKRKKKIIIDLNGNNAGMPDSINIAHQLFNFNINLKQIIR